MRKTLQFFFIFAMTVSYGQVKNGLNKSSSTRYFDFTEFTLSNVILTDKQISGNADKTTVIKVDVNSDNVADYTIIVNYVGYFEYKFQSPIPFSTIVMIWSENQAGIKVEELKLYPKSEADILEGLRSGKITLPVSKLPTEELTEEDIKPVGINPEFNELQPKSTTYKYKVTIINTNFTIPLARFNLTKKSTEKDKIGDILLFNSIGAGFGVSWGELERTTNDKSEVINSEFTNSFGLHLGALFSAGSGEDAKNVFAPTLSFSVLDFQFGYGYELGTLSEGQKKGFFTLAYAIPLSKLIRGKYYVATASQGYNSTNPLLETDTTTNTKRSNWKFE